MFDQAVKELAQNYSVTELREALLSLVKVKGQHITKAIDIKFILTPYAAEEQEYFLLITLNSSHEVIKIHEVTKGLLNRTLVHPREIFRRALLDNAASIIVAHNHPSGSVDPSPEDKEITTLINESARLMGITLLDHVIIGADNYYSFREDDSL